MAQKLQTMSPQFKRDVLAMLIQDDILLKTIIHHLPDDMFDFSFETDIIFSLLKDFVGRYGSKPRKNEFRKILEETGTNYKFTATQVSSILDVYDRLISHKGYTPAFVKDQLYDAVLIHEMKKAVEQAPDLLNKGEYDGFVSLVQKARFAIMENSDYVEYWKDTDDRVVRRRQRQASIYVPTGLAPLDNMMGGGLPKGKVGMIAAGTGFGKSALLSSFAAHSTEARFVGVYASYEMEADDVMGRIDACISGMPINDIGVKERAFLRKAISKVQANPSDLFVYYRPTKSDSITGIRAFLDRLRNEEGCTPDVFFLDYFDLLRMEGHYVKMYEALTENMALLRGLAAEFNMAIWTATQLNRGGLGKEDSGLEDIADAYGKTFTLDTFLTLNKVPSSKAQGKKLFRLKVAKARFFEAKSDIFMEVDFGRLHFRVLSDQEVSSLRDNKTRRGGLGAQAVSTPSKGFMGP